MSIGSIENRKYKRIFFTPKDGIRSSLLKLKGSDHPVTVTIMNLSEGGLGFSSKMLPEFELQEGEHLIIQDISGNENLTFMGQFKLEIKWILKNPALEHAGFGCEFVDLSDTARNQLKNFVAAWYKSKNQE